VPLTNRRPPPPATTTAHHHHDSHAGRCASLGPYPAWPGRVLLRVSPVAAPGIVVAAAAWRDASGVEWTERAPPGTGTGSPGPIPNFAPRSPHTERRPPGSSSVPPRLHSLAQRRAIPPGRTPHSGLRACASALGHYRTPASGPERGPIWEKSIISI